MSKLELNQPVARSVSKPRGNALGRRWCPLVAESLCADARRRTGLNDFGDPPLDPPLAALVHSLEAEADLHPLGRFLLRGHLRDLLTTRLRLVEEWKRKAASLAASRIERPVFILVGFDTPKLASALLQKRQSSTFWNASQLAARIVYYRHAAQRLNLPA